MREVDISGDLRE